MNNREKAKQAAEHLANALSEATNAEELLEEIGDIERHKKLCEASDVLSDMEDEIRDLVDPQNAG